MGRKLRLSPHFQTSIRRRDDVKTNRGFSLLELLIVVAIILVIAVIVIPNLLKSRQTAHESAAVANLRSVATAQITYTTISGGVYGTMPELVGAGLMNSQFLGANSGYLYTFDLPANQRNYTAYATAATDNDGRYDYYTTPDYVIHYSAASSRAPSGFAGQPVH